MALSYHDHRAFTKIKTNINGVPFQKPLRSETLNNYRNQTDEKTLKYENKMMRKAVLYFKMTTS